MAGSQINSYNAYNLYGRNQYNSVPVAYNQYAQSNPNMYAYANPQMQDTVAFGNPGPPVAQAVNPKKKNNKKAWLIAGGIALAAVGLIFHKRIGKALGLGEEVAKDAGNVVEDAAKDGEKVAGNLAKDGEALADNTVKGGEKVVVEAPPAQKPQAKVEEVVESTKNNSAFVHKKKFEIINDSNNLSNTSLLNGNIKDLLSGTTLENYKQKPSNFCHFATPMAKILDDPATREVFLTKILPQKVTKLSHGNYQVEVGQGKKYIINESELLDTRIEGPKGIKLYAKAHEKYLMELNPTRYKTPQGLYSDQIGDVQNFFNGLFGLQPETLYHQSMNSPKFQELLKVNGTMNPKDWLLLTTSKGAEHGIIPGHWYFVKNIGEKFLTLSEPFNMDKNITLDHKAFYNNFSAVKGIKRSDFLSL